MARVILIFLGTMLTQSRETAVNPKIFAVVIKSPASQLVLNNCLAKATLKVQKSKSPRPEKRHRVCADEVVSDFWFTYSAIDFQ